MKFTVPRMPPVVKDEHGEHYYMQSLNQLTELTTTDHNQPNINLIYVNDV